MVRKQKNNETNKKKGTIVIKERETKEDKGGREGEKEGEERHS